MLARNVWVLTKGHQWITWSTNRKYQTLNKQTHITKRLLFTLGPVCSICCNSHDSNVLILKFNFAPTAAKVIIRTKMKTRNKEKWTVKQRPALCWPHSWAWLVVATLIFSFLRVPSDKCWVLFPLAAEESRGGRVKLMYAYDSHSLAGSDQQSALPLSTCFPSGQGQCCLHLVETNSGLRGLNALQGCRLRRCGKQLFANQANQKSSGDNVLICSC